MPDFTKKLKQKILYGNICRKRVLVGLKWALLWFVIGESVGRWVYWGYRRVYFGIRD